MSHTWAKKVLGTFSFRRRYLIWDSYACHIEDTVKYSLHAKKIDVSIVPEGCTKFIQAPDVSWNKPFKALATGKTRRATVNWILEAWEEISPETIKKSLSRVLGI